eukprot:1731239-Prymnesium_polylepis.2
MELVEVAYMLRQPSVRLKRGWMENTPVPHGVEQALVCGAQARPFRSTLDARGRWLACISKPADSPLTRNSCVRKNAIR